MRRLTFILFLFVSSFVRALPAEFDNANTRYASGDYVGAITAYEALLPAYSHSFDLHYNLGAAYFKSGKYSKAILHYATALRLKPTSADTRYNLKVARARIPNDRGYIDDEPGKVAQVALMLNPPLWLMMSVILLACGAYYIYRRVNHGGTSFGAVAVPILGFVGMILWYVGWSAYHRQPKAGVVTAHLSPMRDAPDLESMPNDTLNEGATIHLLDTLNGFYKISLPEGTECWVAQQDVEEV